MVKMGSLAGQLYAKYAFLAGVVQLRSKPQFSCEVELHVAWGQRRGTDMSRIQALLLI